MRLNINKFIYAGVFCCLILTCAGAQSIERKSVELPQISDVKSQLKTATGWALRANGQWVKSGNAIAIPGNSKGQSDNFNSFQLREVAIDDKVYSLLIKKMTRLAYKYPELQMDVYRQEVMLWFVFDKAKLEKVIDEKTEMDKSYGVDLEVLYSDERALFPFLSYGMKEIASEIQSEKQANKKGYNFKNALMAVFPVNYKGKKLVRFNFLSGYGPSFEKETFDNAYYEVDYDAFYKFIRY